MLQEPGSSMLGWPETLNKATWGETAMRYIKYVFLCGFLSSIVMSNTLAETPLESILSQARSEYQAADSLQGAWKSTLGLIKKAEQALKSGDTTGAEKLARKALKEAQLSHAQAKEQLENWQEPAYIRE